MADIKVTFLNSGIPTLLQGATDFFGVTLHSFIIGDAVNFETDPDEVAPRGTITYTGGADSMQLKFFDEDKSLKASFIIPEQYNDIKIGNIMLFALYRGQIKPFASIVLSELVTKTNPSSNITDQNFKYPGNRLVISVTVKYVNPSEIDVDYSVNVIVPNYANLPYFGIDTHIPLTGENPHANFIVNQMTALGNAPAFVTKDTDNTKYFATPLFQNIASPMFGILHTANTDMDEDGNRYTWVWGQSYDFPDDQFRGIIGGLAYDDNVQDAVIIGGLPY